MRGVSAVVPVYDGAAHLDDVLAALRAERLERPLEILVVDDGSRDRSREIVARHAAADPRVRPLAGEGRGAAAATNRGLREARHELVALVDQDVVVEAGFLERLAAAVEAAPDIGAAQGHYVFGEDDAWVRALGADLTARYAAIEGASVDHICTGNSVYRAAALAAVGGLDEALGYGYDNDLSYRLAAAGWRLAFCREARSAHRVAPGAAAYWRRQYGYGYGRLDVVAKHPARVAGDQVSGAGMIAHAAGMTAAVALAAAAAGLALAGRGAAGAALGGAAVAIAAGLALERLAGAPGRGIAQRLAFAGVHVVRDLAWVAAVATWSARRLLGLARRPAHSMWRRAEA